MIFNLKSFKTYSGPLDGQTTDAKKWQKITMHLHTWA